MDSFVISNFALGSLESDTVLHLALFYSYKVNTVQFRDFHVFET